MKRVLFFCFLGWRLLFPLWGEEANPPLSQGKIGVSTLHLWDPERSRPVTTEIWYPIQKSEEIDFHELHKIWFYPEECRDGSFSQKLGKCPLVLFSHGLAGDRRDRGWFADFLVQQGYIVASVEHHAGNWGNVDVEAVLRLWDRPLDISFVLDSLLQDPIWSQYIDKNRIGFSGYSLGGITGLLLAGGKLIDKDQLIDTFASMELPSFLLERYIDKVDFEQSYQSFADSRVQAFFLMAPCIWGIHLDSLKKVEAPFHVVCVENDPILPTISHGSLLAKTIPSCQFSLIPGNAGHYVFLNRVREEAKPYLPTWLYKEEEGVDRGKIHGEVASLAKEFFQKHL